MGLGFTVKDVGIDDYVLDDGNEFRAPASIRSPTCVAPVGHRLRGGFRDPDHRIRYEGVFQSDSVLFQPGDSEMHYTGGGGIVFDKVQFDVGFDRSETVKTFSVSACAALPDAHDETGSPRRRRHRSSFRMLGEMNADPSSAAGIGLRERIVPAGGGDERRPLVLGRQQRLGAAAAGENRWTRATSGSG
jgi:hypothetical protein